MCSGVVLADTSLEGYGEELLRLNGKLHRELAHHLTGIAVDNQTDCLLGSDASLVAVEELILIDLRGSRLMLHDGRVIAYVCIRIGVRPAVVAQEKAVALRVVARILCRGCYGDQSALAVLATTGGDTLGDDRAAGIASEMNHLRAGVRLLIVVGHSN